LSFIAQAFDSSEGLLSGAQIWIADVPDREPARQLRAVQNLLGHTNIENAV
jgi:hypothetical protein